MNKTLAILLIAIFFTNCTKDYNQHYGENVNEGEKESEFIMFYNKFLSDSAFQYDHVQFPLAGIPSNSTLSRPDFKWFKEDWIMHRVFDPIQSGFQSQFTHISDEFIIEQIVHNKTAYAMERRFSRLSDGEWYLIYYAALSPLRDAEKINSPS